MNKEKQQKFKKVAHRQINNQSVDSSIKRYKLKFK